jgi:4-diphosphocytidyl-2-C-methyl-D-erythritol kinase
VSGPAAGGLWLESFAKVNLWLRVVGRRPDGMHELDTCFHALLLHDDLGLVEGGPGIALDLVRETQRGLPVEGGEGNLVVRAVEEFSSATGIAPALCLRLTKRIPAGAGLGGGSSNAAAALRLLNAHHGEPLAAPALQALARRLGADVPFFLRGGTQLGSGIGDRLLPVDDPPRLYFVLLLLPFGVATADVYRNLSLTAPEARASIQSPDKVLADKGLALLEACDSGGWVNDLEAAAGRCSPQMSRILERARQSGIAGIRMSGSGSTWFVASRERDQRDRFAERLAFLEAEGVQVLATESASPEKCRHQPRAAAQLGEPEGVRGAHHRDPHQVDR